MILWPAEPGLKISEPGSGTSVALAVRESRRCVGPATQQGSGAAAHFHAAHPDPAADRDGLAHDDGATRSGATCAYDAVGTDGGFGSGRLERHGRANGQEGGS